MRSNARIALLAPLIGAILALLAVSAPAAQAAFGVESFFSSNCKVESPCTAASTETNHSEIFTQAAGHPPAGITDFTIKTFESGGVTYPEGFPGGSVKNIRTDVGPGESTNPEAVAKCSVADFTSTEVEPEKHLFLAPKCAGTGEPESTVIGENKVTTVLEFPEKSGHFVDAPLSGTMYNLEQPEGLASYFGIALEIPAVVTKGTPLEGIPVFVHTFLEGHIEWGAEAAGTGKADYHDVYEIKNVTPGLISSRIIFKGNIGTGGFLTLPSNCAGIGPQTTTTLKVESYEGASATKSFFGPLGTEGCKGESGLTVPLFEPGFKLDPATTQSDKPDGITTELEVPHPESPTVIDSSQMRTASVTLPEGMTINPSAAGEVKKACTPAQARIHSSTFGVECPGESELGEVTLEVPTLPAGSLKGNLYLGGPEGGGAITGPPYTVYLNAQSTKYGVDVRVEGKVVPNESTGQLTATFSELPEQPFSNAIIKFKGGEQAPIANPLTCGTANTAASLIPYTGQPAFAPTIAPFTVDSNGAGGACASPPAFALTQTTANLAPGNAGANTSYDFNLERGDGQQYLSQVQTTLPPGLVGEIPAVPLCGEAEANAGTCSSASQIGVASVRAGSGSKPYEFPGFVYLTGPYNGAPYGLSIVVPATAGPFSLGNVVTRATINVNPETARVTVTSVLPRVFKGIPLRVKDVNVNINRQGFLINPTNCGAFNTESTLTGFITPGSSAGATQGPLLSSFQVNNCTALAFKPSFKAKTGAKTSKADGASLETTLNIGTGQTNYRSVMVQLPKQLPSRLTTLQQACPEAVFATNPYNCPSGSFVGGARANTPVLPGKLQGPAIMVSHGGEAFPDLDLVMEANGVRVILVGNTKISNGITTTTFATLPDVPVSSVTVNLPVGAHSALTANGSLCINPLTMPTTLTGQNGYQVKQNTMIAVAGCGVRIAGHKVIGDTAYITVQTYAAGRISGSGPNLKTVYRKLGQAHKTATIKVPLSRRGQSRGRPLRVRLRVGFVPKAKGGARSAATVTVTFG
jgi:hypothetical protein